MVAPAPVVEFEQRFADSVGPRSCDLQLFHRPCTCAWSSLDGARRSWTSLSFMATSNAVRYLGDLADVALTARGSLDCSDGGRQ